MRNHRPHHTAEDITTIVRGLSDHEQAVLLEKCCIDPLATWITGVELTDLKQRGLVDGRGEPFPEVCQVIRKIRLEQA